MDEREVVAEALEAAARVVRARAPDPGAWGQDYVWSLPPAAVFVSSEDPPEVGVTSLSEEVATIAAVLADEQDLPPHYFYKLADVLRGYGESARYSEPDLPT